MLFSKIAKTLFVSLLWNGLAITAAQARALHDATGAAVELKEQPQRIIALAPSLAELVADLSDNGFERLVGVTDYTDYPPALKKLPSIGNYSKFNLEKVVSLKPDLVLATSDGNSKEQITHLRELGVPVVVVATGDFSQVEQSMKLVGEAMGAQTRADHMANLFSAGIAKIKQRAQKREARRVLIQLGDNPLIVVGGGSFLSQACELLGGKNVYQDSPTHYPRPAVEDVIRRNPQVIVLLALDENTEPFMEMGQAWQAYPTIEAVKNRKVTVLRSDALLRPTLRLLEGLGLLEKAIYGSR